MKDVIFIQSKLFKCCSVWRGIIKLLIIQKIMYYGHLIVQQIVEHIWLNVS